MILRSVTKHVKDQNWAAVGIDFFIVFVGVFVGLQAQDWSSAKADRDGERAALGRLALEYEQNLQLLEADKTTSRITLAGTEHLLQMMAQHSYPPAMNRELAATFLDCLQNAKLIPALGTTNSLISSGDIGLIGDAGLQSALTQWQTTAQTAIEWQDIERDHGEELILDETFKYLSWPSLIALFEGKEIAGASGDDLDGLFSSKRFSGLLVNRRYNTLASIQRLEALEEATHALISKIKVRLSSISPT